MNYWENVLVLVGLITALVECICLRRRVKKLEKESERINMIVRDNWRLQKNLRQDFSMFENKQKYINHSLDRRIVRDGERAQKTKQALSSLKRDAMFNDGLIKDEP